MCCELLSRKRVLFLLFVITVHLSGIQTADETISSLWEKDITLTCPLDLASCGDLHSIKWTKGRDTIAVVSGDGEVKNVDKAYGDRISPDHLPNRPSTHLNIKNLQVSDDGVYLCETTFVDPRDTCNNLAVYNIEVKVLVPPSAILILDKDKNMLKNGTVLGPLKEGQTLNMECEVRGARPAPNVAWYRSGKRLLDSITSSDSVGLYTVNSKLSLRLSRAELASTLECRVETPAVAEPILNELSLDLQVRPTKISLTGVKHHTVQGTKVLLQCKVTGARPAANVTWYNTTRQLIPEQEQSTISTQTSIQADGTFDTLSQLIFTASRFENGASFRCEADNVVMREDNDKPIHETLVLEVLYPPVVTVRPENITVNEGVDFLLICEYDANPASLVSAKWRKNGKVIRVDKDDRLEGGNSEQTALLVKNASRHDLGIYTCELANAIGNDTSDTGIDVDVLFVPTVKLEMDPDSPVIENYASNVTLYCNVEAGNPQPLTKVRWFLDDAMLKELPECDQDPNRAEDEDLCGIDPMKMLLQDVGRDFAGNYSCMGMNVAGWGPRSVAEELVVFYQPGNATLVHTPLIAVKKKSVHFSCSVDEDGNPKSSRYRWLRGDKPVMDIVMSNWTVDPIGLDSRTNFSCFGHNEGGEGTPATVFLEVHAPPAFIQSLNPYTGALYSTPSVSLSCRVECVPQCSITWFKDGVGIEDQDERYDIIESYLPADHSTGDFESVLSTLHFNMSAWPEERFDIFRDSANYSCVSSNNSVGPGVRSSTYFGVEYPPENATVSVPVVSVVEGTVPQQVLCTAKAFPEPSYEWTRGGESIMKGNVMLLKTPVQRTDTGPYSCVAFNRHGNQTAEMLMNVQYRPNCTVQRKEINDEDTLVCTAIGNPEEVSFTWWRMSENDTEEDQFTSQDGASSFLVLDFDFTVMRTYRCVANNSVGVGSYCEIDVAGRLPWWQRWDMTLIIVIASVLLLLVAVIIICIVIICICRKRRRQDKYHGDFSVNTTTQSASLANQLLMGSDISSPPRGALPASASTPLTTGEGIGNSSAISAMGAGEIPKSPPKWPLRPGVLAYVKGDTKQNICAARNGGAGIAMNHSTGSSGIVAAPTSPANAVTESPLNKSTASSASGAGHNANPAAGGRNKPPPPLRQTQLINGQSSGTGEEGGRNNITVSAHGDRVLRKALKTIVLSDDVAIQVEDDGDDDDEDDENNGRCHNRRDEEDVETNVDELINFTNSNFINRILKRLHWRRQGRRNGGIGFDNRRSSSNSAAGGDGGAKMKTKKSRRRLLLLRKLPMNGLFGSWKSTNSHTELFDSTRHRPAGIKYPSSVVTYKKAKPPNLAGRAQSKHSGDGRRGECGHNNDPDPDQDELVSGRFGIIDQEEEEENEVHDKSSAAGDPLTDPGEYENLPFHGMQSAPNKSPFATHACQQPLTTNSTLGRRSPSAGSVAGKCINNVVRVAPRPKNPSQSASVGNHNVRQNHFANSGGGGSNSGSYRPNLFATDYFQQQQPPTTTITTTQQRGNSDTVGRQSSNSKNHMSGMNTIATNAINFSAYQQPNYPQYAHTAPRNRSSGGGPSPRGTTNANVGVGASRVINDQSGDKINSSFTEHSNHNNSTKGKSLLPNPFLISRAGQSKGKLPVSSSSMNDGRRHDQQQQPGGTTTTGDGTNKKFNSLKSSLAGLRKTPQFYYSMRLGANGNDSEGQAGSKACKRHQSFNQPKADGGGLYEEESGPGEHGEYYYEGEEGQHTLYYEEQPLYENLTDSIQIHELSASSVQPQQHQLGDHKQQQQQTLVINDREKQKSFQQKPLKQVHGGQQHHHHHQHRHHHHSGGAEKMKKAHHKSCDMIERNSIYRSDSGISNSSYECITPVPAPRSANGELIPGAAAAVGYDVGSGSGGGGGTTSSRKSKKKMPVYMNLACHFGAVGGAGGGGVDCVDGKQRPAAADAVNSIANTNPAECTTTNGNAHTNPFLVNHGPDANGGFDAANSNGTNSKCSSHGPFGVISGGNRVNSYGNLNNLAAGSSAAAHQKSSPRQQQILLPKELFPSVTNAGVPLDLYGNNRQHHHPSNQVAGSRSGGHKPRPVKLPLRKHHSFHFQPSQTVAGSKQERSYLRNYYKSNGPLVFKPIKPVPATTSSVGQPNSSSTSSTPSPTLPHTMSSLSSPPSTATNLTSKILSHTSPRICGTKLKRHHSNVEAGNGTNYDVGTGSRGIHTISKGSIALGVYGTIGRGAGGGVGSDWENVDYGTMTSVSGMGKRLHYVELDQSFGQDHTRARREARRRPERGLSFLSDDEGLKRRSKLSGVHGSDCEVENYSGCGTKDEDTDGALSAGLVFGAFEEDRLNLKHFKDKYFLQQPTGVTSASGGNGSGRTPKGSDTQEHPQQLKSQCLSSATTSTATTTVGHPKRTQYATLNFNEVNI